MSRPAFARLANEFSETVLLVHFRVRSSTILIGEQKRGLDVPLMIKSGRGKWVIVRNYTSQMSREARFQLFALRRMRQP